EVVMEMDCALLLSPELDQRLREGWVPFGVTDEVGADLGQLVTMYCAQIVTSGLRRWSVPAWSAQVAHGERHLDLAIVWLLRWFWLGVVRGFDSRRLTL